MAKFEILTGKSLAKAIAGRGKQVATFTEREHQLAYSALNHVELHHCPSHLNALLAVTPTNYRAGLIGWAKAFGKVTFDVEAKAFAFAKGKESNMAEAMNVAPAEYSREASAGAKPAKALMERVERMAEKAIKDTQTNAEDRAFAKALNNFLAMHKRSLTQPKADKPAKGNKPRLIKAKVETPVAAAA